MTATTIVVYFLYLAFAVFIVGFIYRILKWANIPVPLKIVTTGSGHIDNPKSNLAVILRMGSEILVFRSLFRNTIYDLNTNKIRSNRALWLGAVVFHWAFLIIILRHLRLFTYPIPSWIVNLQAMDTIKIIPSLTFSGLIIVAALLYLLVRRVVFAELRYLSIFSDYFILLLLLAIVTTGNVMKYFVKIDVIQAKELMLSLLTFKPIGAEIHWLFALHLSLVGILIAYFPFSKLMHAPGIFFSPTRNQRNDARIRRHVNPWDYPVRIESWEEYAKKYEEDLKE